MQRTILDLSHIQLKYSWQLLVQPLKSMYNEIYNLSERVNLEGIFG